MIKELTDLLGFVTKEGIVGLLFLISFVLAGVVAKLYSELSLTQEALMKEMKANSESLLEVSKEVTAAMVVVSERLRDVNRS